MSFRIALDAWQFTQADAITEIELPSFSDDDLALMRSLAHGGDPSDYARSMPVLSNEDYILCEECDGTGVFLIGCMSPDDIIEQRCVVCLGSGIIDCAESITQPLPRVVWGKP